MLFSSWVRFIGLGLEFVSGWSKLLCTRIVLLSFVIFTSPIENDLLAVVANVIRVMKAYIGVQRDC